jgi:hypothetical protein
MSHVATIQVEIKDLDALKAAAKRCGLIFREGQTTYKWFGHHVGDYPLPAGFAAADLSRCDHAMSVDGEPTAYELGVVKRKDGQPGYVLLYDFWGHHGKILQSKIGKDGKALVQAYATEVAIKHARQQGYRIRESRREDGTVELRLKART